MKVIGIILVVLQIIAILGGIVNGSITNLFTGNIPYLIGYFFPGILGVVFLAAAKKRQEKREAAKNVIFYCADCNTVREGAPNTTQCCPVCHRQAKETSVLCVNWNQLTQQQQEQIKHTWNV